MFSILGYITIDGSNEGWEESLLDTGSSFGTACIQCSSVYVLLVIREYGTLYSEKDGHHYSMKDVICHLCIRSP